MIFSSLKVGQQAEERACRYLQQQGLRLLAQNYFCPHGELDLVMQDANFIVFIEVRFRQRANYGSGLESVTKAKQTRLIKTAWHYLQRHPQLAKMACRFDIIDIDGKNTINWVKNAFQSHY